MRRKPLSPWRVKPEDAQTCDLALLPFTFSGGHDSTPQHTSSPKFGPISDSVVVRIQCCSASLPHGQLPLWPNTMQSLATAHLYMH